MTKIEDSTECSKCGSLIDTSKDTYSERVPCQKCGSISRSHMVHIVENLLAVDGYGAIGKRPGKKKPFVEEMSMPEYSYSKGKIVHKYRLIDRDNDKYAEKVSDYQSGEIIHQCEEPLTEHFGHGSAKHKIYKEKKYKIFDNHRLHSGPANGAGPVSRNVSVGIKEK